MNDPTMVAITSMLPNLVSIANAAGDAAQNPTTPSFGGLGLLIAYLSRRREIGGWLLYFYMQLYVSLVLTVLLTVPYIRYFNPTLWARTDLYVWYLFSTCPAFIAQVAETFIGTRMLSRRTEAGVRALRFSIGALFVTTAISWIVDLKFFEDGGAESTGTTVMDVMTLAFSAIWLAYFYKSIRVRRVFIEHNWTYVDAPQKTPAERRHLHKRAVLWGFLLYVVGFALIGLNQGEAKPDPAMLFGLPIVYALLAMLVSYLFPISKRKRAALEGRGPSTHTPGA
jgi:hypothetical protein